MYLLVMPFLVCFSLCFVITPLIRNLFQWWEVVDLPDYARKIHTRPIPRVGGIGIAVSYVATLAFLVFVPLDEAPGIDRQLLLVWKLLPAAGIVFLTGLLDDLRGLRPWQKLAGELAGAALAWWSGVRVAAIAGHPISDWLGIVISIVWFVGCANAFNLIDGMDGLASGVGLFATLTMLAAALLGQNRELALATSLLAGCLLGFLRYNFNPASIFLGDCGSLSIGFLLSCYGVIWSQKSATVLAVTAPLTALAIPLLDTALAIVRRFLRHQPIFSADRDHIHHRLMSRGLTPRHVALLLYGVCGIAAGFSLLQSVTQDHYAGAIIVLFCGATWVGVQHLGYVEFGVARRMLLRGGFRRILDAQICLLTFEQRLNSAQNANECWLAIRDASKNFGFNHVYLSVAGRAYEQRLGKAPRESCWDLRIPLSEFDYIEFTREFHSLVQPTLTAHFVDLLHSRLQAKFREFEPEIAEGAGALDVNVVRSSAAGIG